MPGVRHLKLQDEGEAEGTVPSPASDVYTPPTFLSFFLTSSHLSCTLSCVLVACVALLDK